VEALDETASTGNEPTLPKENLGPAFAVESMEAVETTEALEAFEAIFG